MIESGLLVFTGGQEYRIKTDMDLESHGFTVEEIARMLYRDKMLYLISQTVENNSGRFNVDQLYRATKAKDYYFEFEDFDMLVRNQINAGELISSPDGKLRTKGSASS